MKRLWAALLLFAVVIGLCLWGLRLTSTVSEEMLSRLDQIEAEIRQEQFETAARLVNDTVDSWKKSSRRLCTFLSHSQLDTADKALSSLMVSVSCGVGDRSLEYCALLRDFWQHLRQLDLPLPENIL
jgi:hypothetical protein